ncbi:MAG: hypothetical protein K9M51_01645 [Candidatus Gracilibacteria bacterium]|nr:hypothetical protein [Candidatus Gracilibacteria bacterium]
MNEFETEFDQFLDWLIAQEEIEPEDRQDLIEHLIAVGTIDEKAETILRNMAKHLLQISQKKVEELQKHVTSLQTALKNESDPALSLKENIIHTEGEKMQEEAEKFRSSLKHFKQEKANTAEAGEKEEESAEIEQLKQNL